MPKILIVDDEAYITTQIQEHLTSMGYDVVGVASSGEEATNMAETLVPDLVLMDIVMSGKYNGIESAEIIKERFDIPVIFLTAYAEDQLIHRAKNVEPFGYIVKPFQKIELKAAIEIALYKKDIERKLRESERKYRILVNNIPCVVFTGYKDFSIDLIDDKIEKLTGYSPEDFNSRKLKWSDIVIEDDIQKIREAFVDALKGNKPYERKYRIKSKEGEIIWIWEKGQIICDHQGEIIFVSGVFSDITHLVRAAEALRKSEETARALLNAPTETALLIDTEGIVIASNEEAAARFGISVDELCGLCVYDHITPELRRAKKGYFDEAARSGKPVRFEDENDGVILDNHVYPVLDINGEVVQLAIYAHDITKQKQAENLIKNSHREIERLLAKRTKKLDIKARELEELNTALKVLLKSREDYKKELEENIFSNVKHLITPYLEILKKTRLDNNQTNYCNILESCMNEFLSPFAKTLSSKYLNLTPQEIRVAKLIKEHMTTKDITELLHVSESTVIFHRHNIRKKIGILNKKINLKSFLQSYS